MTPAEPAAEGCAGGDGTEDMANPARYAKDLLADKDLRFISRMFPLWVAVGLAVPFGWATR